LEATVNVAAWVPLGALLVSLTTLIHLAVANRKKGLGDDLVLLERRLKDSEAAVAQGKAERAELRDELFTVMTELEMLRRRAGAKKVVKK